MTETTPVGTEPAQTTSSQQAVSVPSVTTTIAVTAEPKTDVSVTTTTTTLTVPLEQTETTSAVVPATTAVGTVPETLSLENGSKFTISAAEENVVFKSADTNVAVVNQSGVITAVGEGITIISIIHENGDVDQITVTVTPFVAHLLGDANEDGKITVSDAIIVARIVAEDGTVKVTDQGLKNADFNGKDGITTEDTTLLLKKIAGLL